MTPYYVIRSGWNSANQSSRCAAQNPANQFESNQYALVGIVEAESCEQAIEAVGCTCYNGQTQFAVTSPRAVKGLTAAIREFQSVEDAE